MKFVYSLNIHIKRNGSSDWQTCCKNNIFLKCIGTLKENFNIIFLHHSINIFFTFGKTLFNSVLSCRNSHNQFEPEVFFIISNRFFHIRYFKIWGKFCNLHNKSFKFKMQNYSLRLVANCKNRTFSFFDNSLGVFSVYFFISLMK